MFPKTYFVVGVNGVGKTTLIPHLKTLLSESKFEIHDFDERGVPDGGGRAWRICETEYWLELGEKNKEKGVATIICGFAKPQELGDRAEIILLDASGAKIEERIKNRYQTETSIVELNRTTGKTVEKFIMDNVYYSSILRKECQEVGCKIVDTTLLSPDRVAQLVRAFLEQ